MGGGHAHDDAHGPGGPGETHGHAEIPPAPPTRWISPAREEYEGPWPGRLVLWPVAWLCVALLLFVAARRWSHDWSHEEHGDHEPAGHAAPSEPPAPAERPGPSEHGR